jgi:cell division septation protein DedD
MKSILLIVLPIILMSGYLEQHVEPYWTVQGLATPDQGIATKLIEKLKAKGYDAFVVGVEIDGKIWHRVRLGNFKTAVMLRLWALRCA